MLRAKNGLPKYCCWHFDRYGKRRVRFRKSGFSTYLKGVPYSADFMRDYYALLAQLKDQSINIGAGRTAYGSVNALCVAYYKSPDFLKLAGNTKRQRRNVLENFRAEHGNKPIKLLTRQHIKNILAAKCDTPAAANFLLSTLRIILAFAVDQEMLAVNPATALKKYKGEGDGFHTWTEDEITQFETMYPLATKAGLALQLGLYTAQRKSDVIKMGWQVARYTKAADQQRLARQALANQLEGEQTGPNIVQLSSNRAKTP
jgi:hypothetical protein